jgi:hypothetical protein
VVTTADTSGVLALQTAGTTALSISASQVVTLTNALPVTSGGTGVTTSTGTGAVVLGTSPTITTPTISSLSSASATALTLQSAGTTAVTIDTSQNVGIGTASPAQPVELVKNQNGSTWFSVINTNSGSGAAAGYLMTNNTGTLGALGLNSSTNSTSGAGDAVVLRTLSTNPLCFGTNSTERMRISSAGKVFIGLTNGDTYFGSTLVVGRNTSDVMGIVSTSGTAGDTLLSMKAGANGSDSTTTYIVFQRSDGSERGNIRATGASNVVYNTSSDYRLKTVVGPVTDAGSRLDALEPIEFIWNEDGSTDRGFLAHKFKEVYLRSVSGEKDELDKDGKPKYQSMQASTSEVIADLVSEIQSLRARLSAANIA